MASFRAAIVALAAALLAAPTALADWDAESKDVRCQGVLARCSGTVSHTLTERACQRDNHGSYVSCAFDHDCSAWVSGTVLLTATLECTAGTTDTAAFPLGGSDNLGAAGQETVRVACPSCSPPASCTDFIAKLTLADATGSDVTTLRLRGCVDFNLGPYILRTN